MSWSSNSVDPVLDPDHVVALPALPDILVFPDDESSSSFFAISAKPRLARDETGEKQISLLIYGKRVGGTFDPTGGILSLTVSLGLRRDEEESLLVELKRYLARSSPDPSAPVPAPILLGFPWAAGTVTLSLTSNTTANGQPSLTGDNRCSFNIKLTATQAKAISAAWQNHLCDSSVRYETSVHVAPSSQSLTEFKTSQVSSRDQEQVSASATVSLTTSSSQVTPLTMNFVGSLDLTDEDLESRSSHVAM
jgi:hypothetical protein